MTLQKQTLFVLPLLMTTSFGPWITTKPTNEQPQLQHVSSKADSTLPYSIRRVLSLSHSLQKTTTPLLLSRPQIRMNGGVKNFVEAFLKKNGKDLNETSKRGELLFPVIESIFIKHGLPQELKYLAVVESDLIAKARSGAGAVGYWQLMTETASELGLKINTKTDERKHLRRSTNAAAKYLKALYKEYDDWLLTIAAYNAGPGVVNKAIKKAGSRSFWRLQSHLPAETRGHVKRYIAVHYFFESEGGETTLTKAERLSFEKEIQIFNKTVADLAERTDSARQVSLSVNVP